MKKTLLVLAVALTFGFAANAQTIFSEDFQGGSMPTGWTTIADNLTNSSNYSSFNQDWQVAQISDGEYAAVSISWTEPEGNDCDRWLITPAINVNSSGVFLLADVWGYSESYPEKIRIMVSTTGTEKTDFSELVDVVMNGSNYAAGWNTVMASLDAYANQNIYIAFVNHGDGYYTFVDNVQVTMLPDNSITLVNASAPSYAGQDNNFNVEVTVKNTGGQALTSFDLAYTLNGGDGETINVTGLNVQPYEYYTYTFGTSYGTVGSLDIDITVSNPNGEADYDESDNEGNVSINIYNPSMATQRMSLLEHFTTAQCQYCPGGHERLEEAMNGYEEHIAWVAHHVGFGTDNMTLSASNQIASLYGTSSTWAPAMSLDRNHDYASDEEGTVGSVGSVADLRQLFADATSLPAFVTISLSDLNYNAQTRELSVTISGQFMSDYSGTSPRLTLYITEDGIIGRQQSTSGMIQEYEHNHVIRATVSNIWGDADAFSSTFAGSTYSKTYTYTLPTNWKANKCRLIAFVNEYGNDILHRQVANATKSGYLLSGDDPTAGINDVANINIKAYPNPATEMAYITTESTIRSFEMIDAMGRNVMSGENVNADILELNVSGLASGLYFITVTTDRGIATERLNVVK